jgi:hypothetical protein
MTPFLKPLLAVALLVGSELTTSNPCLRTIGTTNMTLQNGVVVPMFSDNVGVYTDLITLFPAAAASITSTLSTN